MNNIDNSSIVSDAPSTISGTKRSLYQARSRKEKHKKRYGLNGKGICWWDDKTLEIEIEESNFPTHLLVKPSTAQTDPVASFNLRVRGVLIEVESELQVLLSQSSNMALDDKELFFDDKEQVNTEF